MKKYLNLVVNYEKITLEQFKGNYNALSKTSCVTVKASNLFPRLTENGMTSGKYDALIYYSIEEDCVKDIPVEVGITRNCDALHSPATLKKSTEEVNKENERETMSVMKGQGPNDMPQKKINEMDVF